MKHPMIFTLIFCALFSLFFMSCQQENPKQPNIILIMGDDMGFSDIGSYGGEINTPSLDKLAENGLRFTQFYNTSRCCPTRASLLTGLYPHQAGVGHMMNDRGTEAFRGDLSTSAVTIAEVLKTAGYDTYMSGKWHVTPYNPENVVRDNWPVQRGFNEFFGTIHGAGSFYDPNSLTRNNDFIPPGDNFYYTNNISDTAAMFIQKHNSSNPFFMYVAYTTAHWPMHAFPEDIEKYTGRYNAGWDVLREERMAKMIEMGLIDEKWDLTKRDTTSLSWEEDSLKAWNARRMEVYAAMVDVMDRGIGKIVETLKNTGQYNNTLIFYLQDNGGCAEEWGSFRPYNPQKYDTMKIKPMKKDELQTRMAPLYTREGKPVRSGRGLMPGPSDTYVAYGKEWANASNTPFRMYKHWSHEGGIATPLIVHWPEHIKNGNEFRNTPTHLIDIMTTCVELSGADYPTEFNGNQIKPMEGNSLMSVIDQDTLEERYLFWEHEGNRAVRKGKWKLVSSAHNNSFKFWGIDTLDVEDWELFDMDEDRTEMHNIASKYPGIVEEFSSQWLLWAKNTGIIPYPE